MVVGILPRCVFYFIFVKFLFCFLEASQLPGTVLFCCYIFVLLHCLVTFLFTILVASWLLGNYCKHLSASSPAHVHSVHTQDIGGPVNMYIPVYILPQVNEKPWLQPMHVFFTHSPCQDVFCHSMGRFLFTIWHHFYPLTPPLSVSS